MTSDDGGIGMLDSLDGLDRDGFVVLRSVVPRHVVTALADRIERGIDEMSRDLVVSRQKYLEAVCRWSTPNPRVDALVTALEPFVSEHVRSLLGDAVRVGRASIFRKGAGSQLGTHGHQDACYWVRPSSTRYLGTTWIPLDPVGTDSGALRVVPGSHRGPVGPPVDYLAPGFEDPADAWGEEALTIPMDPGDALLFGPRLWHASHPCDSRRRRAVALRWVVDDATHPSGRGVGEAPGGGFGMYTSSAYLWAALDALAEKPVARGVDGVRWMLGTDLLQQLPDPDGATRALQRVLVFLQASERHRAADQRGMVWEQVRELIVAPVIGLDGGGCAPRR
jgi:ectoine hydroxylase-related dioxygenase (phytanoyl-CoA dioxygenase family)